jgi:hypothetical protein
LTALAQLAARRAGAWSSGDPTPPREPPVLLSVLLDGGPIRPLEWLHLLRYKPDLDATLPDSGLASAEAIWRASTGDPMLRELLLGQLAAGLCGDGGLCDSLITAFHTCRPLADAEPHLQEVIAALLVMEEEPAALLRLLVQQQRTPKELLVRTGLPEVALMGRLVNGIGAVIGEEGFSGWLVGGVAEMDEMVADQVAEVVLECGDGDGQVRWWLKNGYGEGVVGSRWRWLSESGKQRMRELT